MPTRSDCWLRIWATYFVLFVWVSSTTVGSFSRLVVNTATSGFQAIMGTATAALGANAAKIMVKTPRQLTLWVPDWAQLRRPHESRKHRGLLDMLRPPEPDLSKNSE